MDECSESRGATETRVHTSGAVLAQDSHLDGVDRSQFWDPWSP